MEYFKVGKIAGTHGITGKMVILHSLGKRTGLEKVEAIFIEETPDSFLPWFIKSASAKTDEQILIGLEGIETREAASRLLKKEVWLNEKDFKRLASPVSPITLLGFNIIDQRSDLGTILEIIEQPHQTLCKISLGENDAWIPLHADSLLKIDRKKKQIFVKLPEGLLDVYR